MNKCLVILTIINSIALILLLLGDSTEKQKPTAEAMDTAYLKQFIYNQQFLIK